MYGKRGRISSYKRMMVPAGGNRIPHTRTRFRQSSPICPPFSVTFRFLRAGNIFQVNGPPSRNGRDLRASNIALSRYKFPRVRSREYCFFRVLSILRTVEIIALSTVYIPRLSSDFRRSKKDYRVKDSGTEIILQNHYIVILIDVMVM